MKKKLLSIGTITLLIISVILLSIFNKNSLKEKGFNSIEEKVEYTMSNMTLEEKIGQMLVVYYTNDTVDENLQNIIKTNNIGGFILTSDNITTYEKTKQFVEDLQKISTIPMIISIDQEGGNVQRLKNLQDVSVSDFPYMYDLGKTKNENLSYEIAKTMAEELKTIGVNVDYAPVLDIYSNPNNTVIGKRSFGEDANLVSKMALSFANGLKDNNIIPVYKHFPGHGDTDVDSHIDLPIINKTYEELKQNELIPFQNAIDNGAQIIMIGHIALPNITNDNTPASLSKKIITDILKNDMNYNGLVITDALNMGALKNTYSDEEIYTMAINAGVDLLLMPNGSKKAIEYIKNNIDENRIDESVKKILTFKFTYLNNYETLDKSYLGSDEHKSILNKLTNNE